MTTNYPNPAVDDDDAVWNRDSDLPKFFDSSYNFDCPREDPEYTASQKMVTPMTVDLPFVKEWHSSDTAVARSAGSIETVQKQTAQPTSLPGSALDHTALRKAGEAKYRITTDCMSAEEKSTIEQMKQELRALNGPLQSNDTYNFYSDADGMAGVPQPRVPLDVEFKYTLLRFCRARKGDPKAAAAMYMAMLKWREENQVDSILDEDDPCEAFYQCMAPHRDTGFDRRGHPLYFESTGKVRAPKMLKVGASAGLTIDAIIRRNTRHMEYLARLCRVQSLKLNRYLAKVIAVYDMTDLTFSLDSASIDMFKQITHNNTNYYPETMQRTFIINAPMSFRAIWSMVKPFLDPVVVQKIRILGSNFYKKLSTDDCGIDDDQIPHSLGGTCRCAGKHSNGDECIPPLRDPLKTPPDQVPKSNWTEMRAYKY